MRRIVSACVCCVLLSAGAAWGSVLGVGPRLAATAPPSLAGTPPLARVAPHARSSRTSRPVKSGSILLGRRVVASSVAASGAGLARAFPFRSRVTGTVSSISVYLGQGSHAGRVRVGLYSSARGRPASRLTTGAIASAKAGAWNSFNAAPTGIKAGTRYWLVLLSNSGALYFRHGRAGRCPAQVSYRERLSSLPSSWSGGSRSLMCPLSAYVTGKSRSVRVHAPLSPVGSAGANGTAVSTSSGSGGSDTTTNPAPTAPAVTLPPVNDGAPAVSGTAQEGQTLSTSDGSWLDSPTSYSYQWQDCDSLGIICSNIAGATASTYTLASGDVGDTIRSQVTATNAGGSTPAASAASAVVSAPPPPSNASAPTVSGTAQQGQTLSTTNGSWTGSPTSYTYAWEDCDSSGASCTTITGATQSTYTLASGDVGHTIRSVVTATNAGGSTPASSAATATVTASPPSPPSNTTAPAVSGTAQQGQTLSTTNGSWTGSPTSYTYAWEDCDSSGASCTTITGATQSTYTLASGDVGHTIRSKVTATNAGGSTPATSAATATVTASPPSPPSNTTAPAVSGTAQQGQTLSTTNGSWTGSPTSYTYAWEDCDSSGASCTTITGATQSTYTLASGDVGHTIRSVVTATNAGGSTPASSAATAVVSSSTQSSSAFPLSISSTGRYLETAQGTPFLLVGDSPQSTIGDLGCGTITNGVCAGSSAVSQYFADRESHGFDAAWVNLLCASYTGCASNGETYDGVAPFTSGSDPSNYTFGSGQCGNCNSTYFTRAHAIVETAEADGIAVFLDPIETGGWVSTLETNGDGTVSTTDADYRYGEYLGNEFKDLPNVVWLSGNDFGGDALPSTADSNDALSVADGIKATDPSALQTVEMNYYSSSSLDESSWSSVLNLNFDYTYYPQYGQVEHGYAQTPTLPNFMGEAMYDNEGGCGLDCSAGIGDPGSVPNLRLQEWWTMTSGATGQLYGGLSLGQSNSGYSNSTIDTTGVTQLGYVTALMNDVGEWYNLVPDTSRTLVTSGYGTCPTTGSIDGVNCVTDAETPDKTLGIAYLPDPSSFSSVTLNLGQMAAGDTTTARWYDPTNGTFTAIGTYSDSGSQTFTPSTNNAGGNKDWVLVLQASDPPLYAAQASAGSNNGTSCANAEAVSVLSTSTDWVPGKTIHLCGTITSSITAEGSGTSGNPITVDWEPGATMSSADWGGGSAINTNNETYLTFNGENNGTSIQATAEGSGLADQGVASQGIWALGCTGCTFENLTIANLYQHTSTSDTSVDQTADLGIKFSGSNVIVADNTIHDVGWSIQDQQANNTGNVQIYGNNVYNTDHGIALTSGEAHGSPGLGPIYIYDNHIHDYANWDTTSDAYHHDGLHCYTAGDSGIASHYNGLYVFDNRFDGAVGNDTTGQVFMEGNWGGSNTPCGDGSSVVYIFDNVAATTDLITDNAILGDYAGGSVIVNNTITTPDNTTARGGCSGFASAESLGTGGSFPGVYENNLCSGGNNIIGANTTSPSQFTTLDNNIYANGGSNSFVCNGNFYNFSQFSRWQNCMGGGTCTSSDTVCDFHSQAPTSADLNSDGSPQSGSPALGAGANLTSKCGALPTVPVNVSAALCSTFTGPPAGGGAGTTTNGSARPSSGAWDVGAY